MLIFRKPPLSPAFYFRTHLGFCPLVHEKYKKYILISPLRRSKFCCGSLSSPSSCQWPAVGLDFEPRDEFCVARLAIKTRDEFLLNRGTRNSFPPRGIF